MDSWKPAPSLTNSAHVAWGGTCGLLASTARNAYLVAFGIVTFLLEAGRLDKTSFFLILVGFRHFSPMLAGAFIREDMCVFFCGSLHCLRSVLLRIGSSGDEELQALTGRRREHAEAQVHRAVLPMGGRMPGCA